jgi:gamma-glutamylcyclotransferase (GGCT)/AIG2-like uncharacterized protein YtfP
MSMLQRYSFDSPGNPGPRPLLQVNEALRQRLDQFDSGQTDHLEFLSQLLQFQAEDGSFNYFDTWQVPSDVRVDFCYTPTYLGAAVLMKYYLQQQDSGAEARPEIVTALLQALRASCHRQLRGHGYEAVQGQIQALDIFISAGLAAWLRQNFTLCPEFSNMIRKITDTFTRALRQDNAKGPWGEDYSQDLRKITGALNPAIRRYYLAYGSNMDSAQMRVRCPESRKIAAVYLRDYQLRFNFHATISKKKGDQVPALLWELTEKDEQTLDNYEGVKERYYRKDYVTVETEDGSVPALVYIMDEPGISHKGRNMPPADYYYQQIAAAYQEADLEQGALRAARQRARKAWHKGSQPAV